MAADDDNFDIDIYGDGGGYANEQGDYKQEEHDVVLDTSDVANNPPQGEGVNHSNGGSHESDGHTANGNQTHVTTLPEAPAPTQGLKRKEFDDRPSDPDATTALIISDLFWWTTDDDVRGWASQADAEDELRNVTFSEHKVNGKSKG